MMARNEISIFRGSLPFHAIKWGYDVHYAFQIRFSRLCVVIGEDQDSVVESSNILFNLYLRSKTH